MKVLQMDSSPKTIPRHVCQYESDIEKLRIAANERVEVDRQLELRLSGIEQKLGSLTWRLAIIAGAVQAASQFLEYLKR